MKETKTIQVYPNDAEINATIEKYESFGWEVIGNQRCQEYDRQTHDNDGSLVNHYLTFNKITFTREKSAPWYSEVTQYEREYNSLQDTIDTYKAIKPDFTPPDTRTGWDIFCCILLYFPLIVPGLFYTLVLCVKSARYKKYVKRYDKKVCEWKSEYSAKIKELQNKQAELLLRAERCVSGRY